ncbi:hypothetical protein N7507_000931 [Penicillium longicatenatum]|nr:hypothetical protein N7507_000931 [Penicillium longicatenatum]
MALPAQDVPTRNLFDQKKFWVSQHVPQRTMLKASIRSHGGTVVLDEKDAEIKIVDHRKKNLPADSYSYQFVERSVQNGKREDLEPYRAGPSAQRPVGASNIPKKTTRLEYTLKDDQILFDWVHPYELDNAGVSGNSIYKALAEKYPHHTYQSWRSRYVKILRGGPRPGGGEPKLDLSIGQGPRLPLHPAAEPALEPKPASLRVPAGLNQRVLPKSPTSRPTDLDYAKRKRKFTSESPSRRRSETGASSPKRRLMKASDAMDSMALTISNNSGLKPRGSQMRSSSPLSSPAMSSQTSQPQQNPPEATTTRQPAHSQNKTEPEQNEATQPQNKANVVVNPLFLEMPFFPSTPEPEQNLATQSQNETDIINALLWGKPTPLASPNPEQIQAVQSINEINIANALLLEMPFHPSSPEPEQDENERGNEDDQEIYPDIDSWIDARLARGNVELRIILDVLQRTSMNTEYADKLLEQFAAGKGIPHDMPGVWTMEDDKCLQGGDQRDIERLFKKHGEELCEARFEFLRLMSD